MRVIRPQMLKSALVALFLLGPVLSGWSPFGPVAFLAAADLTFDTEDLTVTTSNGQVHRFVVELAQDSEQRSQGLMYRKVLEASRGMLFDFADTRRVMMWMQNTYISLDMLFIDRKGIVKTISENAEPLSQAIIDSHVPVAFVLELPAGTVRRLAIRTGDRVSSASIAGGQSAD